MKKCMYWVACLALLISVLCGCQASEKGIENNDQNGPSEVVEAETQATENTTVSGKTIVPLPSQIELEQLENCTIAVSFNQGDFYVNESGQIVAEIVVYDYECFDMVDISMLQTGDVIMIRGAAVPVKSVEEAEHSGIVINGGIANNGYELWTDDDGVYYVVEPNDAKSFYPVNTVTVNISTEFLFIDDLDLENPGINYYPGDFLLNEPIFIYDFTPYNSTLRIEGGYAVELYRAYMP